MTVDEQLLEVSASLDRHGVIHWVDSGTLLGLVRDGKLMDHDPDIDLSTTDALVGPGLGPLLEELRHQGWTVRTRHYRGRLYKVKAAKGTAPASRRLDLSVFRRIDDHYWMPRVKLRAGREVRFEPGNGLLRAARRRLLPRLFGRTWTPNRPYSRFWRQFYTFGVWWIPERFFDSFDVLDGTRIRVPSLTDEYLRYRYENWRTPRADWVDFRDDPALRMDPIGERLPLG